MIKKLVHKNIKLIIMLIGFLLLSFLFFYDSYFFDFDKVEHYKVTKTIGFFERDNDSFKIENKKILSNILFERTPSKLNGIQFLNDLNKIVFIRQEIPTSDFSEIRSVFKEQSCAVHIAYSCISVFRDVLVFYKKNKIVGIAKICFSCNDNHIIGTTSNTSSFGQCGQYEKLNKILN